MYEFSIGNPGGCTCLLPHLIEAFHFSAIVMKDKRAFRPRNLTRQHASWPLSDFTGRRKSPTPLGTNLVASAAAEAQLSKPREKLQKRFWIMPGNPAKVPPQD